MLDRQTSPNPKLPWASLALLFLTYVTFGWLLYDWTSNRQVWLVSALGVVILGGFVSYPSRSISLSFGGFFKTDTRAFILIVLASVGSVILLTQLQLFVDVVVLCTAGLLVSLDLKVKGWSKSMSFLLIISWQLLGMSTGLYLNHLHAHPPIDLPAYFYLDYWVNFIGRLKL
mgnify:FL=1